MGYKPKNKGLAWQFMNLDMFGAAIGFNWGNGKGKYDTCIGASCSLFVFVLLIFLIIKEVKDTYLQLEVPIIN